MLRALWKCNDQKEAGFTLIELMVVVIILGIFAGVGLRQYGRVQENTRRTAEEANNKVLTSAGQMYGMTTSAIIPVKSEGIDGLDITDQLVDEGYLNDYLKSPWAKNKASPSDSHYTVVLFTDPNSEMILVEITNSYPN